MAIGLSYLGDLSRIRIALSDLPEGAVRVERSFNQLLWDTVRGGVALPIVAGAAELDDYEFADGIPNYYRVIGVAQEGKVDVFTSGGTWNKPAGLTVARVTVVSGGGGGGGTAATGVGSTAAAGGGEGGAVAVAWIDAASLGATETVTVGAGGTAAAAGANSGGAGGNSSFGAHVTATGGAGGTGATAGAGVFNASGGAGSSSGTVSTGTGVAIPGGEGHNGRRDAALILEQGHGGSSMFGHGARCNGANSGGAGRTGTGFGGGGSGAFADESQAAFGGGAGSGGLVLVEHFFWAEA